ncbi:MAG: alkanesulfonate monooxygenase [Spirochaetaceae bacterium]|nr:alkanesulfonate monooxygenase [Spirochaetaceae bacterium]|tara:strand:- start:35696 stop:36847 length:1152 start_codon:yes stop_codon:yes gene_type:complete
MSEIRIRTEDPGLEVAYFSDLCNGDYEFLGVPDGSLRSSFDHCSDIVKRADQNGFKNILLPSSYQVGQDVMTFAAGVAPQTSQINLLTALRMGEMHPPMLARSISTLDHILKGRLTVNIISSDLPGTVMDGMERYRRSAEVIQILKQAWTRDEIDFEGEFYGLKLNTEPVKPYQQNGGPLLYFGGISPPAQDLCAQFCDVFLMWPETEDRIKETMKGMSEKAASYGRSIDFGYRVHMIVRETEKEAREYAKRLVSRLEDDRANEIKHRAQDSRSAGVLRQDELRNMADSDGYIEPCLWSGIGRGRSGCGSAIVGDPGQVLEKMQRYVDMGVRSFVLSGYPLLDECDYIARYILPELKLVSFPEVQQRRPSSEPVTPLTTAPRH